MVRWHDSVSKRLEQEAVLQRLDPPRRSSHHGRTNSGSVETSTVDDNGDYFSQVHRHPSRDHRPIGRSRTSSHEVNSPYSHGYNRGVTGKPSPSINVNERRYRHGDELLASDVPDDLHLRSLRERSSSASRSSTHHR